MSDFTIGVVGNPNCGKTTLFNALTGAKQRVGNWPGVTVDRKVGSYRHGRHRIEVVDTPGIYSLSAASVDEEVARYYVLSSEADLIVNISASPYNRGKCRDREKLMRKRSRKHGVYLCYVNLIGGQDELVFDGSSVICSPEGKTIARGRPFGEESIISDIPVHHGRKTSSHQGKPADTGSGNTAAADEESIDFVDLPAFGPRGKTAPKRISAALAEHLAPSE